MISRFKTSGIPLLVASVLGIGNYATYPLPSMAQGTQARTGRCVPAITTGRVRCDYEGGDSYLGQFVNGLPSGTGVYVYSNGDRYEGQFRLGQPNGRGQFIFKNDARVEGIFRDGKVTSGTAIFANGDRYIGPFSLDGEVGVPSGQGQFIFANGDRFVGQFLGGKPLGTGSFTRADGSRCSGQFSVNNSMAGVAARSPTVSAMRESCARDCLTAKAQLSIPEAGGFRECSARASGNNKLGISAIC